MRPGPIGRQRRGGIIKGCLGALATVFVITVALVVVMASMAPKIDRPSPGASAPASPPALRPEVAAFFASHPEFGKPVAARDTPDWAEGPRQLVDVDAGKTYLLYGKGGAVVTVYETIPGPRRKVWGEFARPGNGE